jgi:hypothetical protein
MKLSFKAIYPKDIVIAKLKKKFTLLQVLAFSSNRFLIDHRRDSIFELVFLMICLVLLD